MNEDGALRDTTDLSEGEFLALVELMKIWQFLTFHNGGVCLKSEQEAWLTEHFRLSASAGRVITNQLTETFNPRTLHGIDLARIAGLAENRQLIEENERLKAENAGLRRKHNDYEHPDDTIARGREVEHLKVEIFNLRRQLDAERRITSVHPRAAKLMRKHKNFVVVAYDEPYFRQVYDLIRDHEMQKGTWTQEDQWHYNDAFSSKGR
jgi:hypothetical protein